MTDAIDDNRYLVPLLADLPALNSLETKGGFASALLQLGRALRLLLQTQQHGMQRCN